MVDSTHSQSQYQVRFDWGVAGAADVGDGVDVTVWVDALEAVGAAASIDDLPGTVVTATLRNRSAVADWVLARQAEKGDRFVVAIIAAGDTRADGSARVSVEDLLAAGAVIDALTERGIDHCSPEAAAASAAFAGLRSATRHLVGASGNGRAIAAAGRRDDVLHSAQLDASTEVIARGNARGDQHG
ncbi:2-phosphosulfolactate phosphatase [Marisediminicola senii]|uniref:2-phosphosulfolactate phosphatase n=1 Tax=Marisediminicola senii TaxID=2711233 RepID=UPI0013EACBAA